MALLAIKLLARNPYRFQFECTNVHGCTRSKHYSTYYFHKESYAVSYIQLGTLVLKISVYID